MVRHPTGDGAHHVERVETTAHVDASGRGPAADTRGRAARPPRQSRIFSSNRSAFPRSSCVESRGRDDPRVAIHERAASFVEQQRIFARPLRHDALRQAGHEDHAEAAALAPDGRVPTNSCP